MYGKLVLILLAAGGLLLVLATTLALRNASAEVIEVTGEVIEIEALTGGASSQTQYAPRIGFTGPAGYVEARGPWRAGNSSFQVGDPVRLWVNPKTPGQFRYADPVGQWYGTLTAGYFAVLALAAGLILRPLAGGATNDQPAKAPAGDFRIYGRAATILAFAFLLGAAVSLIPALALKAVGERVEGTVENGRDIAWKPLTSGADKPGGFLPVEIRFVTNDGQELIVHDDGLDANYLQTGAPVEVIYPPTFPHGARVAKASALWFAPAVLAFAGLLTSIIAALLSRLLPQTKGLLF